MVANIASDKTLQSNVDTIFKKYVTWFFSLFLHSETVKHVHSYIYCACLLSYLNENMPQTIILYKANYYYNRPRVFNWSTLIISRLTILDSGLYLKQ